MYIYAHVCMYKHFENHIGIPNSLFLRVTFHVASFISSSEVKYNSKLRIYPVKLFYDQNILKEKPI